MLLLRSPSARPFSSPNYICLSCRLQSDLRPSKSARLSDHKVSENRLSLSEPGRSRESDSERSYTYKSIERYGTSPQNAPKDSARTQPSGPQHSHAAEGTGKARLVPLTYSPTSQVFRKYDSRPPESSVQQYESSKRTIEHRKDMHRMHEVRHKGDRDGRSNNRAPPRDQHEPKQQRQTVAQGKRRSLSIRRQLGTPDTVKQEDEKMSVLMETVLGAHRDAVDGQEVDWNAIDNDLGSAKKEAKPKPIGDQAIFGHPNFNSEIVSEDAERLDRYYHDEMRATERIAISPTRLGRPPWQNRKTPRDTIRTPVRHLHTRPYDQQQATVAASRPVDLFSPELRYLPSDGSFKSNGSTYGIRTRLRKWQELNGAEEEAKFDKMNFVEDADVGETSNSLTRLPDIGSSLRQQDLDEEDEHHAVAHFMRSPTDDLDGSATDNRFLREGDLVELEFSKSERESIIAVFVRRTGSFSQFFTMHGRWVNMQEKMIPYSIPGWVSPDLIQPLLEYVPIIEDARDMETLQEQAFMEDMSVPRAVGAPLVSLMVQFHTESLDVYRKHASALDNAHNQLAHETDLRYGSLSSVAAAILKMPSDKIPVTTLYTVRKALARAGFAFNIDRRSHRLTGYLQIRSKEQVKTVETVRDWLREWQDDKALIATMSAQQRQKHRTLKGARHVYGFVEKAKKIIMKSRENRDAAFKCGNIGPSKTRLSITSDESCIRTTTDFQFSPEETAIVSFIEGWASASMFAGLPRLESMPPLILQATGLYEDAELSRFAGFIFLQEIGTLMPFENRVRSDEHLLLPSSQHSKPLGNLMDSLMQMKDTHNFHDSMKDLRRDWGSMAVYCIDAASAHEIDDGLSIENAGVDAEGKERWWVHIHVANPTAFFSRDHPLAKMARHMGESVYMPERTYMMLPRWATSGHFSLAPDRPCLTFSVKLDADGQTVEHKITSGVVRNVLRLTHQEVAPLLSGKRVRSPETVFTVGGEPPPPKPRANMAATLSHKQVEELRTLERLAEKRASIRRRAGGMFLDMHRPQVSVWQNYNSPGLNPDHPHRKGSRTVEGDPVIQMRTQGLVNWFKPINDVVDTLVREMMLLAGETAASWCAERQIPIIYRGITRKPGDPDADEFRKEVLEPATSKTPDGVYPLSLGSQYLRLLGNTVLSTTPSRHSILGMDFFSKVTSPLRRYGDMILHWQIEAALRQEARTGRSLISRDRRVDHSFLPFNPSTLNTIMIGLQPRESLITRAKSYTDNFWISMLLFRAYHYNECALPFEGGNKVRAYINTTMSNSPNEISVTCVELNVSMWMERPERYGLEELKQGDVWECEVLYVNVFRRAAFVKPLRLLERFVY